MAQVNATIAGRQFRLACEDGQEDHLQALAKDIDERIVELRKKFGEIGDTRLTVMAALTVADELAEASRKLRRLEEEVAGLAGRPRGRRRPRQGGVRRRGRRLQLGGRAHRGHHQEAQSRRSATAWRSGDALTPDLPKSTPAFAPVSRASR